LIHAENFLENEPDLSQCSAKSISDGLSKCLLNNEACKYAFGDGCSSIYCFYPPPNKIHGTSSQSCRHEPYLRPDCTH